MIRSIGFIGLGTVGKYMALNLLKGKYTLSVYDNDEESIADLVAAGAQRAPDALSAVKDKDLVIAVLPEAEEIKSALTSGEGFVQGIKPGSILADMGTHSLDSTMEMAKQAKQRGVDFLDAPVWGTKEHAVNGLLTILAGGDLALISRCREVFSLFGLNTIHVGEIGDATRMKFVVNLMQGHIMEGLAEGLLFGEKFGFSADKILEVLESGGITSPLMNSKARRIARGDFSRNLALKYVYEGLLLAHKIADEEKLELPAAEAVCKVYAQAVDKGYGEEDFSSVIKSLRK
ncbi:MAG: NAD(P)-dependent oxidoreductase [Desulfuromonas sp.]|nr:MAG: NAD(P)-dependent oxidoreductase [Desulfuromonas sp.]